MSELKDKVFENTEELDAETIKKYRVNSVEEIEKDLVEFGGWDTATPGATIALVVKQGSVDQCILNLVGETDPKRMDARTVFGEGYGGGSDHQVRVGKLDLQKFRFRGSLVSEWMSPQEFPHCVQRPATTQAGVWREVEQHKVEAEGGQELWLRAVVQPWSGLKLRVTVGLHPAKDVTKLQDADHSRFPFISLMNINVAVMPGPPDGINICLPFVPYIISGAERKMMRSYPTGKGWSELQQGCSRPPRPRTRRAAWTP